MCACTNETCWGGCPCGCRHTGPLDAIYYRDHRGFVGGPDPDTHSFTAKRVLVIDPENDVQTARLWTASGDNLGDFRARLRRLLVPKPNEPTGLGAVVEDLTGTRWVRADSEYSHPWFVAGGEDCSEWAEINAVRVLSEGITP